MDVSTSICDDPKFRLLQRRNPVIVAVAFTAYIATVAESWRSGRRVSIDHAWPAFVPFDDAVKDALADVGLLDRGGSIPPKTWRSWFDPANERRAKARDRWTRYNAQRNADTASLPRGNHADTATSVPSVPSVRSDPSVPPVPPVRRARRGSKNGLTAITTTSEDAIKWLDQQYADGRIDAAEYHRQREALAS